MKFLEQEILKRGKILDNEIIKVDSFINHQIDTKLNRRLAKEFAKEFNGVDKVLTLETSGIPIALAVAEELNVPLVFAKKNKSRTIDNNNVYSEEVKSFTHGTVSLVTVTKDFIKKDERILVVDDFLARGNAAIGLINIINKGGATCAGVCATIEKSFQGGRALLEQAGYKVVSGANIVAFSNNVPIFK